MAKVDKLSFGSTIIEAKKYSRDVLILADGTVQKRKANSAIFGSHNISKEQIGELARSHNHPLSHLRQSQFSTQCRKLGYGKQLQRDSSAIPRGCSQLK